MHLLFGLGSIRIRHDIRLVGLVLADDLLHTDHIVPAAELVPRFGDLSGERERNDALQLYIKNGEKFRKMELLPVFYFKEDPDQIRFSSYCLVPRPIFSA